MSSISIFTPKKNQMNIMSQNKIIIIFALVCSLVCVSCHVDTKDHYTMHESCATILDQHISLELYASVVYLNMAGYFDRPTVARAGYAKFFRDQSLEEYNHASKFIDYLNKRNATVKRIAVEESPKAEWASPRDALMDALILEKHVLEKIHNIHEVAEEKCDDKHLTDFLESEFYTEQVDSIREIQYMITTISVKDPSAADIIEYTEDKKLLKGKKVEL